MKKSILTLLLVASFGMQAAGQWRYRKPFYDYYKILKLNTSNPTADELNKAYKKAALKAHPDRGGSNEGFALVKEAYETLSNPSDKREYDKALNEHLSYGWEMLSDDDWN